MERKISLEQIYVENPCPADWEAMSGDDQKRFCSQCNKHVHNLSRMTRNDAEELICNAAGKLCVQYQLDTAGQVVTLDYAPPIPKKWWARWTPLVIVMSCISSALAWAGLNLQQNPPPIQGKLGVMQQPVVKGEMIRGDIAIMPPTSQPSTQPTTQPSE